MLEVRGDKALLEDGVASQLVDHTGVLLQIAGRPARSTQKM